MHLAVDIRGIPDLAKNERDVGHPSSVGKLQRSEKADFDKAASFYAHCENALVSGIPANGNRGNPDSNHQMNIRLSV